MATKEIIAALAANGNTGSNTIDGLFNNKFREKAKDTRNIYYIRDEGNEFYKVDSDGNPDFDQTQDYTTGILCVETGDSYERFVRPPRDRVVIGTHPNTIYKKIITADGTIGWMLSWSPIPTTPPYTLLPMLRDRDLVKEICSRGRLPYERETYASYIQRGRLRKKKQKAKRSKRSKSSKRSKRSKSSKRSKRSKKLKKRNTTKKSSKNRRTKRR